MKKAIVTGANGFVGSALVKELLRQKVDVIALAREGGTSNIPKGARIVFFDLEKCGQIGELVLERDVDVFYHFAWNGSAGAARADAALQLKNAEWTVECLKQAAKMNCVKFVGAGSIMEQETIAAAYDQGNKPGAGYIYGSGKLVAHTMCMSVAASLGIDLVWGRITNAYGAGETSPRMLNTTIRKILADEPLQFTAGTQNYDFVYIDDVARAFYLIGEKGLPFRHYLIGSSDAKPLKEFLLEMKDSIAADKEFLFGDIPYTGINLPLEDFDCSLTEKDIGFKATVSFGDGVRKTMDWIKETDGI